MNWTREDVITNDKYLNAFPDDYFKTDIIIYKRGLLWRGQMRYPPRGPVGHILCGHSDYGVTYETTCKYSASIWWAVNSQSSNVRGLPLGIMNFVNEGFGLIVGDVDMMVDAVSKPRNIQNLAYANFSVDTYPSTRVNLMEFSKTQPWITVGTPDSSPDGRRKFLEEVRNHSFVLCPRGNGVDTHRLWETLYMGSIPIVEQDIAHAGWQDLPILFVTSWDEVTEERLLKEKERIESLTWNMEKLRIGYWIKRINSDKPTTLSFIRKQV